MAAAFWLLAALLAGPALRAEESARREAPSYSAASIVNSATNVASDLAPNTIATVYGTGLAQATRALIDSDIHSGELPTVLANTGARVWVGSIAAQIYYVSPTQINFLIPCILKPGETEIQLTLDGHAGPAVRVKLLEAAPALFQLDAETVIATRPDGVLFTREKPAQPGEVVVLYATGLGRTEPDAVYGLLPKAAAPIRLLSELEITIGGTPLARERVLYAGITPGFAGLYQINLILPDKLDTDPEIRVAIGAQASPAGIRLPARPPE